jgi:hypothetical protein
MDPFSSFAMCCWRALISRDRATHIKLQAQVPVVDGVVLDAVVHICKGCATHRSSADLGERARVMVKVAVRAGAGCESFLSPLKTFVVLEIT